MDKMEDMANGHGRLIDPKQLVAIFDSNIYINLINNKNYRDEIFKKEKLKNIKPLAHPWTVLELMQSHNKDALAILKEHCGCTLIADPITAVYNVIYGKESKTLAEKLERIRHCLENSEQQPKPDDVKKLLKSLNKPFLNSFLTKVNIADLKDDAIMRKFAGYLVDRCIKINKEEGQHQPTYMSKRVNINLVVNKLPGSFIHIVDLLKRKASQKKVNTEELSRDRRDGHIIFYAGMSNVYFVTEEKDLLNLKLVNVLRLKEYKKMLDC